MSIGVVIITHNQAGLDIIRSAEEILGKLPLPVRAYAVEKHTSHEEALEHLTPIVKEIDSGEGILIMTDLYGSTPHNIAVALSGSLHGRVISGANLPMLIRVLNYPNESLPRMLELAYEGGSKGVIIVENEKAVNFD